MCKISRSKGSWFIETVILRAGSNFFFFLIAKLLCAVLHSLQVLIQTVCWWVPKVNTCGYSTLSLKKCLRYTVFKIFMPLWLYVSFISSLPWWHSLFSKLNKGIGREATKCSNLLTLTLTVQYILEQLKIWKWNYETSRHFRRMFYKFIALLRSGTAVVLKEQGHTSGK